MIVCFNRIQPNNKQFFLLMNYGTCILTSFPPFFFFFKPFHFPFILFFSFLFVKYIFIRLPCRFSSCICFPFIVFSYLDFLRYFIVVVLLQDFHFVVFIIIIIILFCTR